MNGRPLPIATHGLTHLALRVADAERAFRFYETVLGMVVTWRGDGAIQAQTPGARDVIVFEEATRSVGRSGGIEHFGFRLTSPADIDRAAELVHAAGGTVTDKGEFVPGEPYLFARDLDGYLIEIWYELPTAVDPR